MNTEGPVRRLLAEIDRYLATLGGPGVDAVRSGLAAHAQGPVRPRLPQQKDCLRHLAPALRQLAESGHQPLADAIADASPHLRWVTYDAYGTERDRKSVV